MKAPKFPEEEKSRFKEDSYLQFNGIYDDCLQ